MKLDMTVEEIPVRLSNIQYDFANYDLPGFQFVAILTYTNGSCNFGLHLM